MQPLRARLTYANVTATIALFIALGGTSVAAIQLGRDTVGSEQIVNESIASGDIDRGAVRSRDIRNRTITRRDVRNNTLRGRDIHNGTITRRDVRNGTLRGRDVRNGTLTGRDVWNGTLHGRDVRNGSITADDLADGTIQADDLGADAVTGGAILDGTITAGDLADGTIPELQNLTNDGPPDTPSLRTLGSGANQAAAGDDPRLSDARTPTGNAGGDLTGTFPNPVLADGAIDSADLFSALLRDGAASQPSLRTLGTGANQAAAGDDPRLSDARTPTGNAGGDLTGTYPNPTIDSSAVDSAKVANGSLRLADFAVLNSDGGFTGGTIGANDCALAAVNLGSPPQLGDRVFFLFPNDVPTSVIIPPQVWPGGNSITISVCNMDNAAVTVPTTVLTIVAFR